MSATFVYALLVLSGFVVPIPILLWLDRPRGESAPAAARES